MVLTAAGRVAAADGGRSFFKVELLRAKPVAAVAGVVAVAVPCLAAEDAVGAVADAGRRTGRVGDFGLGLEVAGDCCAGSGGCADVEVRALDSVRVRDGALVRDVVRALEPTALVRDEGRELRDDASVAALV